VHIEAVAEWLGHSSIAITGDVYGRPRTAPGVKPLNHAAE
jgi:integrase